MTGLTFSEETLKAAAKKSGGFKKEKQNWQSTLTGTRQRTRHLTYFPFKLISSYNANFPDSQVHATSPDNEPREQHRQTFPGHTYFLKWPDTSVQHLIQASTHKVIHSLRFFFFPSCSQIAKSQKHQEATDYILSTEQIPKHKVPRTNLNNIGRIQHAVFSSNGAQN